MALVRRIARPLLASPFIVEGVRTALKPERDIDVFPKAFEAADSALAASSAPSFVDVRTVVRATGAVAAGAGLLFAAGKYPRAAAATLLVTTSVGWAGRKRVWELKGAERKEELQSLLTELGLLGGIMLATVDHEGRPSLGYQMTKFVERSQKNAEIKQREAQKAARKLPAKASKKADAAVKKAQQVTKDSASALSSARG